ncbi:MAG: acyl-CoA thioesterase [Chthonomonas sp.]|nr:acyl-CoA thioesterase [Chthonomonas sp.]
MNAKRVSETKTKLAQIMTPNEANVLGKVFGGAILAMIDLTASATAQKFSGHIAVTASFDRVDFHEPIEVGNLVAMEGHVSFVGRTSMEITIDVVATNLINGTTRASNTARVTMVAMSEGKPVEVPRLICESREEKINFLIAKSRRERRQAHQKDIAELRAEFELASDAELDGQLGG